MNVTERKKKFNEFLRISQEGILGSSEIVRKLGISINTLYNWRKRIRAKTHPIQKPVPQAQVLPEPFFSKVAIESKGHPIVAAPSFIEIAIGNAIVLRVPSQVSADVVHAILDHCAIRGQLQ